MDIAMPEMDGIETTRHIRALNSETSKVPIVAMTAHAFKSYRQRCLDAGMNDFASKPISKAQLLGLVEQWCGISSTTTEAKDSSEQAIPADLLDSRVLEDLQRDVGIEDMSPMIAIFINELTQRKRNIQEAMTQQSLKSLANEVHILKSTAGTFGAKSLRDLALKCNACCEKTDLANALEIANRLLICLDETLKALEAYR
jgi:CheY-like chemotaxis protein